MKDEAWIDEPLGRGARDIPLEEMIVRHMRGLFLEERPAVANAALTSIIARVGDERRADAERVLAPALRGEHTLFAAVPGPNFAPDLVLVRSDTKEAVAAFEWKVGANGNRTFRTTVDNLPRARGEAAAAIHLANDADPRRSRKQGSDQVDHDAVPQLDAYLAWEWWSTNDDFTIDPENVLWVYVDLKGRRPEDVDVALVSAGSWALLDPLHFLRDLYRASIRFEDPEDRDAVAVLGWSLWARGRLISKSVRDTDTPEDWVAEFDKEVSAESHELNQMQIKEVLGIIREERELFGQFRSAVDVLERVWDESGSPTEGPIFHELNNNAELLDDVVGRLLSALATLHFEKRLAEISVPSCAVGLSNVERFSVTDGVALGPGHWPDHGIEPSGDTSEYHDIAAQWGRGPGRGTQGGRDGVTLRPVIDFG